VNKVLPNKFEKISRLVRKGLMRKGIEVLGIIPYTPMLSDPTIEQILEETDFELLCGKDYLENSVSHVMVGAMEPHNAIKSIVDDTLLITPGDREDLIIATLGRRRENDENKLKVSGIILSCGIIPDNSIMALLNQAKVPVLSAKFDTYTVTSAVHDLTVKIRPQDTTKIKTVIKLIKDNVDLNKILKGI
jgi:BioD-like phosphotransacetylase family protein